MISHIKLKIIFDVVSNLRFLCYLTKLKQKEKKIAENLFGFVLENNI